MTISIARDFPLPIPDDKLGRITGLKVRPNLALVDLSYLSAMISNGSVFPSDFLTSAEMEKKETFTFPKRELEWIGGRLAAKQAAINVTQSIRNSNYPDWQTTSDEYGRPYIDPVRHSPDFPPVEISISHSDSLCVAMGNLEKPCGIDIQKKSSAVVRVQEKFSTEKERNLLISLMKLSEEELCLTVLWSAKEALRKACGGHPLTGFMDMDLSEIKHCSDNCWILSFAVNNKGGSGFYPVISFIHQDYGCSVVFG